MESVNIKELYNYGRDNLKQNKIDDYDIIAKLIIEHVCNIDRNTIIIHEDEEALFYKLVQHKALSRPALCKVLSSPVSCCRYRGSRGVHQWNKILRVQSCNQRSAKQ